MCWKFFHVMCNTRPIDWNFPPMGAIALATTTNMMLNNRRTANA